MLSEIWEIKFHVQGCLNSVKINIHTHPELVDTAYFLVTELEGAFVSFLRLFCFVLLFGEKVRPVSTQILLFFLLLCLGFYSSHLIVFDRCFENTAPREKAFH